MYFVAHTNSDGLETRPESHILRTTFSPALGLNHHSVRGSLYILRGLHNRQFFSFFSPCFVYLFEILCIVDAICSCSKRNCRTLLDGGWSWSWRTWQKRKRASSPGLMHQVALGLRVKPLTELVGISRNLVSFFSVSFGLLFLVNHYTSLHSSRSLCKQ